MTLPWRLRGEHERGGRTSPERVRARRSPLSLAASLGGSGAKAQPALDGEPHEGAAEIGAVGWRLGQSLPQAHRQRFDLLESDAARIAPARRGDAPRQNPLDDRDRRFEERAGVDGAVRAEPRLDFSRQMGQSLLGFARAARETIEGLGVEAFLAEAREERAKAGAREARVGVGRIVDEWSAARLAKATRSLFFRPMSGRAISMPSRVVIASMPRRPATPEPRNSRNSTVSA